MTERAKMELAAYVNLAEIIQMTADMVALPSHQDIPGQEAETARYIRARFQHAGIGADLKEIEDGRYNVVARLPGSGGGKSLLLCGNTDTVPPYDMPDPFTLTEREGRLYGRGAVDMKGPIACMISAMTAVKRAGLPHKGDILFAGVAGEETRSVGMRAFIREGAVADVCIIGEPSHMHICLGHKGLAWYEVYIKGKAVHGGRQKEGVNAIEKANKFMNRVAETLLPKIESRAHPIIGNSTMNYGIIKGGTQPSTVAGECLIEFDRRWVPSENIHDITEEYRALIEALSAEDPDFHAEIRYVERQIMEEDIHHESNEIPKEHPAVEALASAVRVAAGKEPVYTAFPAWTDAGLTGYYGKIPTIVCGPGNLESAHSEAEYVEKDELSDAAMIYALTALQYTNG